MTKISRKSTIGLRATLARPTEFVSRLVLAELVAKRGRGPLERKKIRYARRSQS